MEERIQKLAEQGKTAKEIQVILLWDHSQHVPLNFIKKHMK